MKELLARLFGLLLLGGMLMGLFVVLVMPFEMWRKLAAESWPSRPARITDAYVSAQRGRGGLAYRPMICARYEGETQTFCVSRLRYGGFVFGGGERQAREAVARYPEGSRVAIHYDPDDPKETVLEARSSWTEMLTLSGVAIGFLSLPVFLWLFRRRGGPVRRGAGPTDTTRRGES